MSAPSGYRILDFNSGTFAADAEVFTEDILFTSFPDGIVIEIQIQFTTDLPVVLELSADGGTTWLPVNNNETIQGIATFTVFMEESFSLNFRSPTVGGFTGSIAVVV